MRLTSIAIKSDGERRELSGVDKVTALLLAMSKPQADRIIKQLEDTDIRSVARSATELPEVRLDVLEALLESLSTALDTLSPLVGSTSGAQQLLSGVVADETLNDLMGELAGEPPKGIWSRLAGVADARLAQIVAAEEPQVAAYLMSQLPSDKASGVMELLSLDLQAELGARLLTMKTISNEAARLIAERLARLLDDDVPPVSEGNRHARLGSMLNKLERERANDILKRIEARSPDDARKVERYIFSFEDLQRLTQPDLAKLLDEVPTDRLSTALKDADPEIVERVLAALSPRARRLIESELSSGAAPPEKVVTEARRSIAAVALALAERAVIQLGEEGVSTD